MKSLFESLGGTPAVEVVVETFYRKVLMDDRISRFFDDVDMDRQLAQQRAFLTMAFGGPHRYQGKDLRAGHAHLVGQGLADEHVDIVIDLLRQSLWDHGVPASLISQVEAIAQGARDDVLGRPQKIAAR